MFANDDMKIIDMYLGLIHNDINLMNRNELIELRSDLIKLSFRIADVSDKLDKKIMLTMEEKK